MRKITSTKYQQTALRTIIVGVLGLCFITGTSAQEQAKAELEADVARLDALRSTSSLDTLRAQIDQDAGKWRKTDRNAYVAYMRKACGVLSSYDIGDQSKRAVLLSEYSLGVLSSNELPLQEYVQFVEFLSLDPLIMDETTWKNLRSRKTRLWLEGYRRVSRAVDPNFDFNDRPALNVSPPSSTGLPAGISPVAIQNPQLRTEYENAIAENRAKSQRYIEQNWLKRNAPSFYAEVERYLVNAYTRQPSDLEELQHYLAEYVDPATRDRVLQKVRKSQPK